MASENTYFVIFDTLRDIGNDIEMSINRRIFVKTTSPQEAVDMIAEDYGKDYKLEKIQVFQRIMNGVEFFWEPSEANK